jgi:enamine deaminase RidA (YjgF/YER057c/UK114 family)
VLIASGQTGADRHGNVAVDVETQIATTWDNVLGLLQEAGTSVEHLVHVTTYLTRASDIATYRKIRTDCVPSLKAPSTLLVVSALADPRLLVEVEVLAVVPGRH